MVAQKNFPQLVSVYGCLSILLLSSLGTGVESLTSKGFCLEQPGQLKQQREKTHYFIPEKGRLINQKGEQDDRDDQDDPNCQKRGCVPHPRYAL